MLPYTKETKMSSEKAEMGADQVSLPPTYAPSEAFTESPPPAYKKTGNTAVRVAKIVCLTAFAITFLIGFFVVAHKWVQTREVQHVDVEDIRHEPLIAQAPSFLPMGDNELSENSNDEKNSEQEPLNKVSEQEEVLPEQVLPVEPEAKSESQESQGSEDEDVQTSVQNEDPVDLLLGNSELAGLDPKCRVEKRRQKIGEGIFTEAVIVTCNNDEENEEPTQENHGPLGLKKFLPPMSLLGDIMKIIASKARARPIEEPRPENMAPRPMPNLPFPLPFLRPMQQQFHGPNEGPMPPQMLRFVPLNKIEQPMLRPAPQMREIRRIPFPPPHMGLHPVRIIKKIVISPNPEAEHHGHPMQAQNSISPVSIINSLNEQDTDFNNNEEPRIRVINHQPEQMNHHPQIRVINPSHPPMINFNNPPQVRIIKVPKQQMQHSNFEHREEQPMPPMHPLIRLMPSRGARLLRIVPLNINNDRQAVQQNEEQREEFQGPIPRGNLPLEPRPYQNEGRFSEDESVPEASGRSLPSPRLNFPGLRLLRLPGRPPFHPFPNGRIMTHMELQAPPTNNETPEEHQQTEENFPQMLPSGGEHLEEEQDFGPPRTHTVIESAPEPIFRNDAHRHFNPEEEDQEEQGQQFEENPFQGQANQDEPISQPQFLPKFFVPPPPRFAPEGRSSPFAEINPDAEQIAQPSNDEPHYFPQENHHVVLN